MTMAWEWGYVQDVRYSGFAGRLYGCSRLITSGTSNPAKTGDVKTRKWGVLTDFYPYLVASLQAISSPLMKGQMRDITLPICQPQQQIYPPLSGTDSRTESPVVVPIPLSPQICERATL